jgi:glycosyltransferase involved in cell wall biosynthesis
MSSPDLQSDEASPRFTIAIPTFNRARLLKGCVSSALSQTYPHFEVVVSDNASTDETQDMLRQFSDRRLRVIRQDTNIGLIPNWNACLKAARGDYILILSDDDRVQPWLLQRCVEIMGVASQVPIVITLCNPHSMSLGRTWPARTSRTYHSGIWDGTDILMEFLTNRISVAICSVVMRTDLLRRGGGISPQYPHAADFAAWAPMLFLGEAGLVNEACATFAYHKDSETTRLDVELRLRDDTRMADLISRLADDHVTDPRRRAMISSSARACFARRALITLSDYRNNGGDLRRLLTFLWRFRRDLRSVDARAALRFVATVACPQTLANWLRGRRPSVTHHYA